MVDQPALYLDHAGMWLCMPGRSRPFQPSNAQLQRRARTGPSSTELARACGNALQGLDILDACAGFGSDGLLLAQLGAKVRLVEREPLIWVLLHERSQHIPGADAVCGDALEQFDPLFPDSRFWDVILLDPMFPPSNKRALPNLGLQYLRELTKSHSQPDAELSQLLSLAKTCCRGRVVVKRRLKDEMIEPADFQIKGKSVRFDVYRGLA